MYRHIEDYINKLEDILNKKKKNYKEWENIFPSFFITSKNYYNEIKKNDMEEDIKKLLSYVKPLKILPEERVKKRLKNLNTSLNQLKEKYLIRNTIYKSDKQINLFTQIKYLKHVGQKRANILEKIDIKNLYDCLYNLPRDYEDKRKITKICNLQDAEKAYIIGKITNVEKKVINKGLTIYKFIVEDETGIVIINYFNQNYISNYLKKGILSTFYGKIEKNFGVIQLKSPEFKIVDDIRSIELLIEPIYSLSHGISQNVMRKIFKKVLEQVYYLEEFIPEFFIKKYSIIDINKRIIGLHYPYSFYHLKKSLDSLKYEELIIFEYAIITAKYNYIKNIKGISKKFESIYSKNLIKNLPFKLTQSQLETYEEIKNDIISNKPMNRLLQGDVGSGKTIVCELAILDTLESGFQCTYMLPTSVLAKQQFRIIKEHFKNFDIKIELLIGETKYKNEIKNKLKNKEIDLLIGTHAVIQEDVEFHNLGLVVIDEQHRFGVKQRANIIKKGIAPDILVMTATPIPRTFALTLYGDMDVSVINQMPKGRKTVKTILTKDSKEKEIYDFIEKELEDKNQIFFIYPLIEESEKIDLKNAKEMYENLRLRFKKYTVGLLHGKMNAQEKEEVMEKYRCKEIDVLVSTSVVEVGVDIPDATVMVIEHAERFGLSQLHQLRGRVGRSNKQSYCFLIINNNVNKETIEKLQEFSKTHDGFIVSEIDLKWRGPGNFFGTQQHGIPEFKFVNLSEDLFLIEKIKEDVELLFKSGKDLNCFPLLKKEIKRRFSEKLSLIYN